MSDTVTQRDVRASSKSHTSTQEGARKATFAGSIGNLLEVYDLLIYGYSATLIASLFFPAQQGTTALLLTFGVYAIGFGARPIGAVLFGHFGDKVGRRSTLVWSVVLMTFCTVAIGLLPTFASIGFAAPLLLTLLRVVQGISAAGEVSGSATFIVEHAPPNKRGLLGSFQQVSSGAGFLLASVVILSQSLFFTPEQVLEWAWRVPFFLGGLTGLVALWIRFGVHESPEFEKLRKQDEVRANPLLSVARSSKAAVAKAVAFIGIWVVGHHLFLVYVPTFLEKVAGVSRAQAQMSNVVCIVAFCILLPVFGKLSDKIGRRPVLLMGVGGFALAAVPVMMAMATGNLIAVYIAQLCVAAILAAIAGPGPATIAEMFPTEVRYSAMSLGWNISATIFGGLAPFLATLLIQTTGLPWSIGFWVLGVALISLVVVIRMPETAGKPMT